MKGSWVFDMLRANFNIETEPVWRRAKMASHWLAEWWAINGIFWKEGYDQIEWMNRQDDIRKVVEACQMFKVKLQDVWQELPIDAPSGFDELLNETFAQEKESRMSRKERKRAKKAQRLLEQSNPAPAGDGVLQTQRKS